MDIVFLATLCLLFNADWDVHDKNIHMPAIPINRLFLCLIGPIPLIYPIVLLLCYIRRRCRAAYSYGGFPFDCKQRNTEVNETSPLHLT